MKTGIDLIFIPSIAKLMENEAALRKMLHPSEMRIMKAEHLAGKIALKEAFFKAFEMKPRWLDLEVKETSSGKPKLIVYTVLIDKIEKMDYSISHDGDYAVAQVVVLMKK